jgi:hypothetical protein
MLQHSPKYDPSIHEELEKADWDAALPKVFKYALSRAKIFKWLGDDVEPEALVQEAIARAYGVGTRGTYRNWNKETCPDLGDFLIGIIRSMTSHKAEHEAGFPSESLFNDDGSPKDGKFLKSYGKVAGASKPKNPETEIIEKENLQALQDELDRLADGNEDLGMVILCIEEGISEPRKITEMTGFDKGKVNNLLRKLRRKLDKYNPKRERQSSKERREEWI